ncbi:MAG: hypothetical protein L6V93_17460 [Clostridiales bacterium]|nr:MAG: hypothetical protein L6V93_17460 [Clostridiales bacterium]
MILCDTVNLTFDYAYLNKIEHMLKTEKPRYKGQNISRKRHAYGNFAERQKPSRLEKIY